MQRPSSAHDALAARLDHSCTRPRGRQLRGRVTIACLLLGCAGPTPSTSPLSSRPPVSLPPRAPIYERVPPAGTLLRTAVPTSDGRRLAVVSQSGDVAIWQISPPRFVTRVQLSGPQPIHGAIGSGQVELDPSGEVFAAGTDDGRVHAWRLEPFQLLVAANPTPPGTTRVLPSGDSLTPTGSLIVGTVSLSPDLSTLAAATGPLVILWDLKSGQRRDSIWVPPASNGMPSNVGQLAFSPSDGALIVAAWDGGLYNVNPRTMHIDWRLNTGLGQLSLLKFDRDGNWLAIAGLRELA